MKDHATEVVVVVEAGEVVVVLEVAVLTITGSMTTDSMTTGSMTTSNMTMVSREEEEVVAGKTLVLGDSLEADMRIEDGVAGETTEASLLLFSPDVSNASLSAIWISLKRRIELLLNTKDWARCREE